MEPLSALLEKTYRIALKDAGDRPTTASITVRLINLLSGLAYRPTRRKNCSLDRHYEPIFDCFCRPFIRIFCERGTRGRTKRVKGSGRSRGGGNGGRELVNSLMDKPTKITGFVRYEMT